MAESSAVTVLPHVLFVDARTGLGARDEDQTKTDLRAELQQKLSDLDDPWRFLLGSADDEEALDQLDETRCVFMLWSVAAANQAYEDLKGLRSDLADKPAEALDEILGRLDPGGENSGESAEPKKSAEGSWMPAAFDRIGNVLADIIPDRFRKSDKYSDPVRKALRVQRALIKIGEDRELVAALAATPQTRARLSFTTLAAVVGRHRGRIVWHHAFSDSTAADIRLIADELAQGYTPSGRPRPRLARPMRFRVAPRIRGGVEQVVAVLRTPLTFEEVLREEMLLLAGSGKVFRSRRENVFARAHQTQLVGLAFSGGGIRSATFNLGVLQSLARHGLLQSFHYLSTVSGGGYIGSWYSAWLNRAGPDGVHMRLKSEIPLNLKDVETPLEKDWSPITWLRRFSNYLTPQTGLLSLDTWTAVVTYLRNLTLNLMVLLLALSAILLVPRLAAQGYFALRGDPSAVSAFQALDWLPLLAGGLFLFSLCVTVRELGRGMMAAEPDDAAAADAAATPERQPPPDSSKAHSPAWVFSRVVVPLFGAAVLVPLCLPTLGEAFMPLFNCWSGLSAPPALSWTTGYYAGWMIAGGIGYFLLWAVAVLLAPNSPRRHPRRARRSRPFHWARVLGWALIAGALGAAAAGFLATQLQAVTATPAGWIWVLTFGPPAVVVLFLFTAALHIGLIGRAIAENYRQWWSRLGAWQLILALGWLALFALVFYGPPVLEWVGAEARGALSLTWVVATAAGLLAGRSPVTGLRGGKKLLEGIAVVAPYVFALGMLAAVSLGTREVSGWIVERLEQAAAEAAGLEAGAPARVEADVTQAGNDAAETAEADSDAPAVAPSGPRWHDDEAVGWLEDHPMLFISLFLLSLGGASLLSWRVDVNEFSMHNFYRNRLVRAYLGASNTRDRNPVPFTGFDERDDVRLRKLASNRGRQIPDNDGHHGAHDEQALQTPIHILNTTLNLTAGEELAWQERKASSFFFTPFHFGFDPGRFGAELAEKGFRHTPDDERFTLGTALAISGAAVNPNMGYHSSTALAFLMTVFNSRLGWWFRNPSREQWDLPGPRFGLTLLLEELRGTSGATSGYVNLADGGFFENLGVYELVRRRCRFILACDAEADPNYEFNGLGNAIRRCRSDFGIDIRIQLDPIRKQARKGFSRWHCAVGKILYSEADEKAPNGILVYLKASLTGDEPEDLLNYAARRKGFPHESTADQWFGETQFESYRMLGYHETCEMFQAAGVEELTVEEQQGPASNIENVFVALQRAWYPPSTAEAGSFTRHTERLVRIFDQVRENDALAFLDQGLYLDVGDGPGADDEDGENLSVSPEAAAGDFTDALDQRQGRAGFYLSSSMIQLMENVYLDLDLEQEWAHPDNRGWMNLFRHWATMPIFRRTWAMSAASYGARFQSFCRHRLKLDLGVVWIQSFDAARFEQAPLSPLEKTLIASMKNERGAESRSRESFHLLQMSVLGSAAMSDRRRDNPLAPMKPPDEGNATNIPFGIAITDKQGQWGKVRLTFFRVRNHLRQLGLARQALQRLVVDHDLRETDFSRRPLASSRGARQLKNVFLSVLNEYYRWKDALMADVYRLLRRTSSPSADDVQQIVSAVERRARVASGTVSHILRSDLAALKGWLERKGADVDESELYATAEREHGLPRGTVAKIRAHRAG